MKIKTIITGLAALLFFQASAQRGYSSASLSMNRNNGIHTPDQVVVEEYLNYHTHRIPLPVAEENIAMELRWGSKHLTEDNMALLQVGLASSMVTDFSQMPPVNISLVIDKSGSMQGAGKLEKVKKALFQFVKGLRSDDLISIVAYDTKAYLALSPTPAGDLGKIKTVINSLEPGGSTNLNGGMVLGYEQVLKNLNSRYTNRVILLTDGLANQGITDQEQIITISTDYNKKGVDISTIGVGGDINHNLLRQLAQKGKGQNHFVGEKEEDIIKVFDQELEGLLSSIAKDVVMEIEYDKGLEIEEVVGYSPEFIGNKVILKLDNINGGLTQVVLLKFKGKNAFLRFKENIKIQVSLTYRDPHQVEATGLIKKETTLPEYARDDAKTKLAMDNEVQKNYIIGQMAIALKQMATLRMEGKPAEAITVLQNTRDYVNQEYPNLKDKDLKRVSDILNENLKLLEPVAEAEIVRLPY